MEREVYLVKSFTKDPSQGSPTAVMLNADGLSNEQMGKVAEHFGFSESVFVWPSDQADVRLRFISPNHSEVALCGYGTIGSFNVLRETDAIDFDGQEKVTRTQETKAGILPVTLYKDGLIVMTQVKPEFMGEIDNRQRVAALLSISPKTILDQPIEIVSTGTPKLIIPVESREVLFAIKPDLEGIKAFCLETGARGFYPYTTDTIDSDSDFHARQFNPLIANDEDPITGVAAGALGAYLVKHNLTDKPRLVGEQGYIMNKSGKMYVEVGDEIQVGGYAVTYDKVVIKV